MRTLMIVPLLFFLVAAQPAKAALPVKLLQGQCPKLENVEKQSSIQELHAKLQVLVPSMMAQNPNTKSWRILSATKLNSSSPYYKAAAKACDKRTADESYIVDVIVTKKATNFPYHIHLLATNEVKKGWLVWGLTTY